MRKTNKAKGKSKPDKSLGYLQILSERKVESVEMDIEMSNDFRDFLLKKGREAAEENLDFYVGLGLRYVIEKSFPKNKNGKK